VTEEARGLWVGIEVPKTTFPREHPLSLMMPKKDPHITLIHFGRTSNIAIVDHVVQTLRKPDAIVSVEVEMTGWGVFLRKDFQLKIALINSAALFELRSQMIQKLEENDVSYDRQYGFIPHITLSSYAKPWEHQMESFRFRTASPVVVWGDQRFPL
jgi:2'-5' RNA ligase